MSALNIKSLAATHGFEAAGVCAPDALVGAPKRLRAYLDAGYHGDMLWMETRSDERSDPRVLWSEVKSVIALGLSYAPALDPLRHMDNLDTGVISVYALGKDYHDVVKKKLKSLARALVAQTAADVKVFVDTAPVMEKPLAQAAGLGWQGKHTNLVSRRHGSWLFLGAIYTTLDLPTDTPMRDHCGSCTACQNACPTNAFPAPYQLDARRCISYLTIEHKGPIPLEFRNLLGNRIYGCDDCLAVCPWNKFAVASKEMAFAPRDTLTAPKLAELAQLDDAAFRALFSGSPVKRIGRDRFVRNVLYAIGNSKIASLQTVVRPLLEDSSDVVQDAASWALAQLKFCHADETHGLPSPRPAAGRADLQTAPDIKAR
jgi:epoxyqueuosine reductase